ncbi:MAG: two-component regulator propeller domain-containing protein, partial [Spirochaetaceae bacterium]|nr:two-component regulator propeller domain-containing protein [Spirochaetaceae bacterium]
MARRESRSRSRCAFVLAAALALPATAGEDPGAALFTVIGTRDGLPNSSVSGIVQDRRGFIWFGTQGGLARYDGLSFKRYGTVPFDEGSLPHDLVQTVYLDGDAVWAGTYGGLSRFDPATERFVSYRHDPGDPESLSNPVVTCIARDVQGALWAGTLSGLNRLDEGSSKFKRYLNDPTDGASLPVNNVRALKVDRKGRLWVGTSGGGLARYQTDSDSFASYRAADSGLPSDFVMSIDEDESGFLWIGTWYGALSRFDPESGECVNYALADDRVYTVCAAVPGTIYAGTWGGGLFQLDLATGSMHRYRTGNAPGSLPHDIIYSLLHDRSGELWIGTNGGGIAKLGRSWRSYEAINASVDGLPPGKVFAVLVD